jgi:hypothetical protein
VAEALPLLYLHGLSSSDFGPALQQFLAPATACRQRRSLEHLITRLREIASRDDAPSVEDLVDYLRASGETHARGSLARRSDMGRSWRASGIVTTAGRLIE